MKSGYRRVVQHKCHAKPVILFDSHELEPSKPNSFIQVKGKRVFVRELLEESRKGVYRVYELDRDAVPTGVYETWEDELA